VLRFRWETEFRETEIGEIPREWGKSEIGSFMVIRSGKRPKEVKVYGFYEVWGANGFMDYTDDTDHLENREVLITGRVGTLGNVYYIKKNSNVWLSDNVLILYPNDQEINLKFVFYHLLTRKEDIINLDVGSTQPLITQNGLKNLIIPLPPLPEQSRIATVLSWFDDLIEVKKRQNEILEKTAMAIFKNWFVDFEPFKNEEFVYNEELGREMPKGWEVKKIIDLCNIISGRGRYLLEASEGIYPLWGANGVLGYIENYDLEGFSIITGRVGTIGNVFLVEGKFAISDNVLCIMPHQDFRIFFLYLWIKSQIDFESLNVGTSQPLITKTALGNEPIIFPPHCILQSFHSLVEPLFQKIILNQKQIMTLRKIRDTLLPLLVFGKLRVEEV